MGSKFSGLDRNGPNYRIGADCAAVAGYHGIRSFQIIIRSGLSFAIKLELKEPPNSRSKISL